MSLEWLKSIADRVIDYILRRRSLVFVVVVLLVIGGIEIISGRFITDLVFALLERFGMVLDPPREVHPLYGVVLIVIAAALFVFDRLFPSKEHVLAATTMREIATEIGQDDHPTPALSEVVRLVQNLNAESQETSARETSTGPPLSDSPDVSISHLPVAPEHFVGREAELDLLGDAWADSGTNVISIVAFGGVGKSALVARWLQVLAQDNYRGARRVFGHSFYSQGSRETSAVSADAFIESALEFFGEDAPHTGSPWDKGVRLAKLVRAERTLLILDGLEPLQQPPTSGDPGRIKDPALQALVRELSGLNPGLCVISTREKVTDIPGMPEIDLEQLSDVAGAALLKALGVEGGVKELEQASSEVKGHGLALTLLGTYLAKVYKGDARQRDKIELFKAGKRQGDHARHMVEKYEQWLGEGPEVSILRLLGLFDRPAEDDCIDVLRAEPGIPDLTSALVELGEEDWRFALSNLQDCGLLARPEAGSGEAVLDAHPLVREYFKDQLNDRFPEAAREAHRRLYEHLEQATDEYPDNLQDMMPLYHAVAHGCAAGLHQKALDDVYYARILRGDESFSVNKLGAIGADLSAVACFFDRPWDKVCEAITEKDKAWVLGLAGYHLRALGRLDEAAQSMRAGLEMRIAQMGWKDAAIGADNLSELHLASGAAGDAVRVGEQSVELADRGGDNFRRMANRTSLAYGLHQAARREESLVVFREAETMQEALQPESPLLYSLQGFQNCDLLLDVAVSPPSSGSNSRGGVPDTFALSPADFLERCGEVRNRAELTLPIAKLNRWLLDIGLDRLTLGRTHVLEAETRMTHEGRNLQDEAATLNEAQKHLNDCVDLLRQAGQQDHLSRGLLARAALFRVRERFDDTVRDLVEAESNAERGGMLRHQIDAALERCRLALAQDRLGNAREALALTKELVTKTEAPYVPHVPAWEAWDPPSYVGVFEAGETVGYHRHDREIAALEERLARG